MELRLQSKDVLTKAAELGIKAKNHMVDLSDEDTAMLKAAFNGRGKAKGPKPAAKKAKPPTANEVEKESPKIVAPKKAEPKKATPRRITKEELVDEQRNVDGTAVSGGSERTEPKKAKPLLKVAYKDTGEDKPAPKQAEELPESVIADDKEPEKEAPKPEKAETPKMSDEKIVAEKKPAEKPIEKSIEKPIEKPAKSADKPKADIKPNESSQKKDDKSKKEEKAKKSGKPKGEKRSDKKQDKQGDKKPAKRTSGGDRRRDRDSDRRNDERRTPILTNSALEKKPVRSHPRPKTQPKISAEPAFDIESLAPGTKIIKAPITVAGFAEQTDRTITDIIMTLMSLGVMANMNQNLDEITVQLLGEELNIPIYIVNDEDNIEEEGFEDFDDKEEDLVPRPPIITVMGHVDHGKTSLLDAIRKTSVTKGEAGGITQHIGASEVTVNGERIVFLDTPGHEAFTAMRARGAHVTDIAVLVVAADDGVMPQTIESISHARAAGVPIIVAINKIDKEGSNPDRVKSELADNGVLVEDWGGDIISVPVSAKSGEGITNLLEMILLQAEVLELKANPNRLAMGSVIEAYLDKSRGAVATLLVMNGTLESGMSIVAGMASGRIRVMTDFKGKKIRKAGPATAVEVTGLSEAPQGGDEFRAVRDDRMAREIAENRKLRQREEIMARTSGASLDTLFSQISENEVKELNIIIKGDVQGSVGALTSSLEKLSNDEVKVRIIHRGVGAITESDVMLANTSNAVIIGFNVRPSAAVTSLAERDGVEIRTYRVIYDAIGDVESAMKGMLDPEFREVVLGSAEVRETFKVPGIGVIAGSYITNGLIRRNAQARVVRDGIVIYEGNISSLKRFKDDAREVNQGFECGIGVENFNDIKIGDVIEAFTEEEIERE
jgi:translation initiation factor IF-2